MEALAPELHRISETLLQARASGRALAGPPDGLPETLEFAYALQDYSIAQWNDEVAGWKVGGVPPAYADRFEEKFLAGPIFARSVFEVGQGGRMEMAVFENGFAAIEPEFVFRLGDSEDEDRLFIGAEIASSPIPDINDYGPTAVISDFGNNNGLVLGPEIPEWRSLPGAATVRTTIDGALIGETELADFREKPRQALHFFRQLALQRGLTLRSGIYVSSGAITGVHEAKAGAYSNLEFGDFGSFEVILVNAEKT